MKITQIRNATLIIEYAGKRFLIDPMLGPKGAFPPYPFADSWKRNPIVELPISIDEILHDIDAVIATHYHYDHLDSTAFKAIPKRMKIFVKDERNHRLFVRKGFSNVEILSDSTYFGGIKLGKTPAKHGTYPLLIYVGKWKSHATLTLLAKQDLPTFGYNMIDPLKSWCWGSILFYPFKISRFS